MRLEEKVHLEIINEIHLCDGCYFQEEDLEGSSACLECHKIDKRTGQPIIFVEVAKTMKIRWNLYKSSGKWYAGGIIEIPYKTNIWDANVRDVIMTSQKEVSWTGDNWQGCFLTVEPVDKDLDKFFTNLFKL